MLRVEELDRFRELVNFAHAELQTYGEKDQYVAAARLLGVIGDIARRYERVKERLRDENNAESVHE